jgi:DNA-binding NarL/FixJ family response regulator
MLTELINVAIVDDHTLFRKTLQYYIAGQHNINVVIQTSDIFELLSKLKNTQVHVLLLEICMPHLSAHEAIGLIHSQYPDIKILILSMCTDMDLLSNLMDGGVYGILSKTDEPDELIQAILSLSQQKLYKSRIFTEVMYWNKQHYPINRHHADIALNKREKEVIQLLWEEKSNKEIAEHLFLGIRSVEKIRQDMKEKLSLKSTVGLFKYGITNKIIEIRYRNSLAP